MLISSKVLAYTPFIRPKIENNVDDSTRSDNNNLISSNAENVAKMVNQFLDAEDK